MRLLGLEFKKLMEQPMIIIFFILCLLFNAIWILTSGLDKENMTYVQSIREEVGTKVTPEMEKYILGLPDRPEKNRLLHVMETTENSYLTTSSDKLAESINGFYQLSGRLQQDIEAKYAHLDPMIKDIQKEETSLEIAAGSETMPFFTFIRNVLLKLLLAEGLIFSLLVALFSSTSETMTKTDKLIFTTKVGKKIQISKYLMGLLLTLLFFTALVLATFSLFNYVYPLGNIWQSNLSNQFHLNVYFPGLLELPFITWVPMTLKAHTLFSIGLSLLLMIACFSLHFIIGLWLGHLFKGFVLTVAVVSLHKLLVIFAMTKEQWLAFKWLMFSPIEVWEKQGFWFTEMGPYSVVPFQESLITLVSLVVVALLMGMTYYYYPKKEVL